MQAACKASITPRNGFPGATCRPPAAPGRLRSRTIGRRGETRSACSPGETSQSSRAAREVRHHDRQRLLIAVLATSQLRHGRRAVGPAGEVVAAQALEGDDLSRPRARRLPCASGSSTSTACPRRIERLAAAGRRRDRRSAGRGSGGWRVFVLRAARRTHGERRHGRPLAVVRAVANDRQPRAAVGAVEERIAVAAVAGSNSSRRQSSQVATSGEMKIGPADSCSLASIRKRGSPRGKRDSQRTSSIRASGGGLDGQLGQEPIEGIELPLPPRSGRRRSGFARSH